MAEINIGKFINNLDTEDLTSEKLQGVANNVYAKAISTHKKGQEITDDRLKDQDKETVEFVKDTHDRLANNEEEDKKLNKELNESFRELVPGDAIISKGKRVVIGDIFDQHVFKDSIDIEFKDVDGNYRTWKSDVDGGKVEYKESLNEDAYDDYFGDKGVDYLIGLVKDIAKKGDLRKYNLTQSDFYEVWDGLKELKKNRSFDTIVENVANFIGENSNLLVYSKGNGWHIEVNNMYESKELKEDLTDIKQEWEEMTREPIIEFDDEYYYIEPDWENGKLYAGSATNTGIFHNFEIDLDPDLNLDGNIAELYDHIISERPELLGEDTVKNGNCLNEDLKKEINDTLKVNHWKNLSEARKTKDENNNDALTKVESLTEATLDKGEIESHNNFNDSTTFEQWFDIVMGEDENYRKSEYYPFENYVKHFPEVESLRNAIASDIVKNAHIFYDVYPVDSTDREYAFNFAKDVTGKDYELFYNAWLNENPITEDLKEAFNQFDESLTEAKSSKKLIYTIGDRFVAHQLDGVTSPFNREFDAAKKYRDISNNPNFKHGSIGCKGKSYKTGVNQWVKDVEPTEFMVWTKKENPSWKDDVLDVYYRKETINESKKIKNKTFNESLEWQLIPESKEGGTFAFKVANIDENTALQLIELNNLKFDKLSENGETEVWLIGYTDTDHIATYVPSSKTLFTSSRESFRNGRDLVEELEDENEDGWGETVKDLLEPLLTAFEDLAYEIRNARRGAYAGFGTTIEDLINELERLGADLDDVVIDLESQKHLINEDVTKKEGIQKFCIKVLPELALGYKRNYITKDALHTNNGYIDNLGDITDYKSAKKTLLFNSHDEAKNFITQLAEDFNCNADDFKVEQFFNLGGTLLDSLTESVLSELELALKRLGKEKADALEKYLEEVSPKENFNKYMDAARQLPSTPTGAADYEKLKKKFNVLTLDDVLYNETEWNKFEAWLEEHPELLEHLDAGENEDIEDLKDLNANKVIEKTKKIKK